MDRDDLVGVGDEVFTVVGEQPRARLAPQQAAADGLLETPDLVADRGLGQRQALRRAGHPAAIVNGLQRPQQVDVQSVGHGYILYMTRIHGLYV